MSGRFVTWLKDRITGYVKKNVSLGDMPISLRAMLLGYAFLDTGRTLLWVVDNEEEMYAAMDSLYCFVGRDVVQEYPSLDFRPYQDVSPSKEVVAKRIAVLERLVKHEATLIVSPVDALLPHTIPPEDFRECMLEISEGDYLDRDEMARRLVHMGYSRTPLVDGIGQFSIRGFVVDIYSPGMQSPVRLEMFGDEVERMTSFDLSTQRSRAELKTTKVLPASEIIMDKEHIRNAKPRLRRIKEPLMPSMLKDIEQGIYSPGIEMYLPYFYQRPATFFDYLNDDCIIASPDDHDLKALWSDMFNRLKAEYSKARSRTQEPIDPRSVVLSWETLEDRCLNNEIFHISTSIAAGNRAVKPPVFYGVSPGLAGSPKSRLERALSYIYGLMDKGMHVFVVGESRDLYERLIHAFDSKGMRVKRIATPLLSNEGPVHGIVYVTEGSIGHGFILPDAGIAFISSRDIFGEVRHRKPRPKGIPVVNPFTQLNLGDAVVHRDHGIGIFRGVKRLELGGLSSDFVLLEYTGGDKLYVPVYRLGLLQRYIGDPDSVIIDRLGGTRWKNAKNRARKNAEKLAGELLEIYAKRASTPGFSFRIDEELVRDFASGFIYDETDDQLKTIEQVYDDMSSSMPMDRLVCGDVGYGKTEVALRASFVAVMQGKQVAILVPTTILAHQHLMTFRERFNAWPVRVEALTSSMGSRSNRSLIEDVGKGRVDILIGTHALLSERLRFKDLGLLVVDEEHRFGVRHKERIKKMRSEVDVLTLSATPIPRTLHMAISGIRDLSVIETPPAERKSIETTIARFDDDIIKQAIEREISRGGQVFFVHNRVFNIDSMAQYVRQLVPGARVGVAHGQMLRNDLNRVMSRFIDRDINVLVCSAIIGSGLDIPNANTIIVNRADRFGMADLYQLRGRVGRSKLKGYALLLIPALARITEDARKRLAAIKEYGSLGAGFQMALKDMEIRGVGEILGSAQWGSVTAIGFELYQEMLRDAVMRLKGKPVRKEKEPEIRLDIDAYIPDSYCPDQHLRLGLYKRLSIAESEDVDVIEEELRDMYGPIPGPMVNLLGIARIRVMMKQLGIRKLESLNKSLRLWVDDDTIVDREKLVRVILDRRGKIDPRGIIEMGCDDKDVLLDEILDILSTLA